MGEETYTTKELDRLVVYSGDSETLPATAYRRATRNEARKIGVGIGFQTITNVVLRRIRERHGRAVTVEDLYLPVPRVRRELRKFLRLVQSRTIDDVAARREARLAAFVERMSKNVYVRTKFGHLRNGRQIANSLDRQLRSLEPEILRSVAEDLAIPTMIDCKTIVANLVEHYNLD